MKNLKHGLLLAIPIPLPPLLEQRAIVSRIEALFSELDKGVEQLETARRQLKQYRQSVLKAAFEGKLTAEWRAAQPDLPSADELPSGWRWAALQEVLVSIQAGKSFRCEERPPAGDEVGVVKVSAVTWGTFQENESKTCVDQAKINPAYFISDGDFLFSRANTIELVGACVIVARISKRLMLSDKILRFSWKGIVPEYVLHWLRSVAGRHEIERLATGNQNSMRNIGQANIKRIRLPLPPLAEQQQIVAEIERRFSVLDELEGAVERGLEQAAALRQSILKKAFEGRLLAAAELAALRADPAWEPAEKLLEKIKKSGQSGQCGRERASTSSTPSTPSTKKRTAP